ncbi:MAG: hydantoinase B/oxoprolinase family protein [Pseudomonadota bacterium]|nr:hydantoinase B/oxoprolinase family protein [Pseudomonadota bacterium]
MAHKRSLIGPVELEVCWNRLVSIANEQAATMVNAAFSVVLGEMEDLSAGVFDHKGTMLAQSVQGAPGHLGSLGIGVKHIIARFDESLLVPGDILVTNDPWLVSGHKHDITVVIPVFLGAKIVGYTASNCHVVDIGGRIFSAAGQSVYEEGLQIPVMKLYDGGSRNETLFNIIAENVRSPDLVLGDLMAQVSANQMAGERLLTVMTDHRLQDLTMISEEITGRTESMMRVAISRVPDGVYHDTVQLDGFGSPLHITVSITVKGDEIIVDFDGTSSQIEMGVNCVLNYTKAFVYYAVKCSLSPDAPNNEGSFRAITVKAPPSSILNATYPAPVGGRHLVGLFVPFAVFGALSRVIPDQIMAESSVLGAVTLSGVDNQQNPFVFTMFCSGGMGARPGKNGLDATAFPSNVANAPVEIIEQAAPILVTQRELIEGSAGKGMYEGGVGQRIGLSLRSDAPANISTMFERALYPPKGLLGGCNGSPTRLTLDGKVIDAKHGCSLRPGSELTIETAGGGGFGSPISKKYNANGQVS